MNSPLTALGKRLRAYRRQQFPDDTQKSFALRLGINKNTLSAMENGKDSVAIGHYLRAAQLLECEIQFDQLFIQPQLKRSLFDEGEVLDEGEVFDEGNVLDEK